MMGLWNKWNFDEIHVTVEDKVFRTVQCIVNLQKGDENEKMIISTNAEEIPPPFSPPIYRWSPPEFTHRLCILKGPPLEV